MTDTAMENKVSLPAEAQEKTRKPRMKKGKAAKIATRVVIYAILVLYAAIIIAPFLVVLSTSLKVKGVLGAQHIPFEWFPETGYHIDAYPAVFEEVTFTGVPNLLQGFLNTLMYILPPTLLGLFTSSLSAFAFAKLRFRAKRYMYTALLATMMIPGMIMLAPQLIVYDYIGWTDTPLPLMIPGMFGAAACVFFMRQFFSGIPDSLIEAAKIDGLGFFGIFFRIMVPLSVPALLAQGLLGFVGGYNDFFGPLIYLGEHDTWTLQLMLREFTSIYPQDPQIIMAACLIALAPLLILYFVCQKFFLNGIAASGLKD